MIPHRDRGVDPLRQANLDSAVAWWRDVGVEPVVLDDGRAGDEQFCRSAAYNAGLAATDADIVVFSEADLLVPIEQIEEGVYLAHEAPGLVVPFSKFLTLDEQASEWVRSRAVTPPEIAPERVQQVRGDRKSIGAVNIVSRETMRLIGGQYDEKFEGHAYDDDAMERAFSVCCGPTRFVDGPGWHQYHLPGAFFATPDSTEADRAATEANRVRWGLYRRAGSAERIRELVMGVR